MEEEYHPDDFFPAPFAGPARATRSAQQTDALVSDLLADRGGLRIANQSLNEENADLLAELQKAREALTALQAEKDGLQKDIEGRKATTAWLNEILEKRERENHCLRGNHYALETRTDEELEEDRQTSWGALDSIMYEQYSRFAQKYRTEYEQKQSLARPECCICLSIPKDAVILPCSHTFCKVCIEPWLINHGCCPTCRAPTPSQAMISNRAMRDASAHITDHKADRDLKMEAAVGRLLQKKESSYEALCKRVRSYTLNPDVD
jgi:hypothetical protein